MSDIIYTLGYRLLTAKTIIQYIKNYGINCIVDASEDKDRIFDHVDQNEFLTFLKQRHISYLSFKEEFGFIPASARNSRGIPVYSKVCELDSFKHGISRLQNGMTKGFTILLIEEEHSVYNSNRYLLIGKYLSKQDIKVNHILENGTCYSQESIDEIIVRRENEILAQKNKAADLGQTGEELAALHLMRKGYMILDHNWNLHKGCELDLIARKDGILHFVEVKTRSSDKRGAPQQAIDLHKIHNIQKAIKEYMSRNDYFDMPYQVDSIAIIYHSEEDYSLDMQEDIKFQTTHNN